MTNNYRSVSTHNIVKIIGFHTNNNFGKNRNFFNQYSYTNCYYSQSYFRKKMPNTLIFSPLL